VYGGFQWSAKFVLLEGQGRPDVYLANGEKSRKDIKSGKCKVLIIFYIADVSSD
jgi:hypothetical protein